MEEVNQKATDKGIPKESGMMAVGMTPPVTELCGGARASNQALSTIGPAIQWQHSYVATNRTFCIYLADGEDSIRKHGELSGIPIAKITEVPQIIDPLTANN